MYTEQGISLLLRMQIARDRILVAEPCHYSYALCAKADITWYKTTRLLRAVRCLRKRVLGEKCALAGSSLNLSSYKILQVEKMKLKSDSLVFYTHCKWQRVKRYILARFIYIYIYIYISKSERLTRKLLSGTAKKKVRSWLRIPLGAQMCVHVCFMFLLCR